jgi:DNA-binding NarL/FixJ family response regulator
MARTVLIVDDHAGFRRTARRMLEAEGYEVVGEASDARSAEEMVQAHNPEVVILDIRLPDGDGFELAPRLKQEGRSPAIVLVSSHDQSDFGAEIAASPALGFIAKGDLSGESLEAALT